MDGTVTIGEFSRLTHLTAKALRHYHDAGLLIPERIDTTGYRRYGSGQVRQAQLIGRLRRLDMPLPEIKAVLAAPDEERRDQAIAAHLQRMEGALGRTTQVVASLRGLLGPQPMPLAVEYRTVPAMPVLGIRDRVTHADIESWCAQAYPALHEALAAAGVDPAGPGGASYDKGFFEQDVGEVMAFVPVADTLPAAARGGVDRCQPLTLPGGRFAMAQHSGPYIEIDRSYGALGSHVAAHDAAQPDPIRELYHIGPDQVQDPAQYRTEIWWPIAAVA